MEDYTSEAESCDRTSDQPKTVAAHSNDTDGFGVDPEPTVEELQNFFGTSSVETAKQKIAEFVMKGLQGPRACGDSDSKLDSLLSMFPYTTSESRHNIAPSSNFQQSTVDSQECPRSFTEACTNLQKPWASSFNNFPKTEKKDAVWNSIATSSLTILERPQQLKLKSMLFGPTAFSS
jgi:hypothetical protein